MNHKVWSIMLVALLALLGFGAVMVAAQGPASPAPGSLPVPRVDTPRTYAVAPGAPITPTDFITVTSTADDGRAVRYPQSVYTAAGHQPG
jgi:hypothetical protein